MNKIILAFAFFSTIYSLHSQNIEEAISYSRFEPGVTARSLGVGGSMGAIGADFSSILTNPAGIGWNRNSVISASPGLYFNNTEASLLLGSNDPISNSRVNIYPASIGGIIHTEPITGNWKSVNFGIGMNRNATSNRRIEYDGRTLGTIGDYYAELANGTNPDFLFQSGAFDTDLAYQSFLISLDPDILDRFVYLDNSDFLFVEDDNFRKEEERLEKEATTEINLAAGANYDNKLLLGASVNLVFTNRINSSTYIEDIGYEERDDQNQTTFTYNSRLEKREYLRTRGFGFNLKLGGIYRISQTVRAGLAVHTPSFIALKDSFTTDIDFAYSGINLDTAYGGGELALSPIGEQKYRITTPWRIVGNLGFVIGKYGFITTEAEWTDYSSIRYNLKSDFQDDLEFQDDLNFNQIDNLLRGGGLTLRFGAEARLFKKGRLRAGVQLAQSPYKIIDELEERYSFGAGWDEGLFYIDAAFQTAPDVNILTEAYPGQPVNAVTGNQRLVLTAGVRIQ